MGDYPAAFSKHAHRRGCEGALYDTHAKAYTDRLGRVGNGGLITHDFRCNHRWEGCCARVLVTARAFRLLAVGVEVRPGKGSPDA